MVPKTYVLNKKYLIGLLFADNWHKKKIANDVIKATEWYSNDDDIAYAEKVMDEL